MEDCSPKFIDKKTEARNFTVIKGKRHDLNLVLTNPKDHVLSFKPVALNHGCTLEISWEALKPPDTQAPSQPIKVESLEVGSRQG